MGFLTKKVTLRINLLVLLLVLLLLGAIIAGVYFLGPQNLFFMLLSPAQVESAQVRVKLGNYRDLSSQEISELISVLKEFRITDKGERCITPESQMSADYHIHMKWGLDLHIYSAGGIFSINANRYADHAEVADRLFLLHRQHRQVGKEQ